VRVHGDNLKQKEGHPAKYRDAQSRVFLGEIRPMYDRWADENNKLKGPVAKVSAKDRGVIDERVRLFSEYKDFLDQQKYAEQFDSRSNLHSSVLEEFVFYLFRDLVASFGKAPVIGKSHTFKDIFFFAQDFKSMVEEPSVRIEEKDHDFVIGVSIETKMKCRGADTVRTLDLEVPAVAIECKTYLDKTMLEGSSTAAEQLKVRSPNALYVVLAEWLKLTEAVNLKKYKVDQIYVLRKQKNTDREFRFLDGYKKNPVSGDVVWHLFSLVRAHLTEPWGGGLEEALDRGWLL